MSMQASSLTNDAKNMIPEEKKRDDCEKRTRKTKQSTMAKGVVECHKHENLVKNQFSVCIIKNRIQAGKMKENQKKTSLHRYAHKYIPEVIGLILLSLSRANIKLEFESRANNMALCHFNIQINDFSIVIQLNSAWNSIGMFVYALHIDYWHHIRHQHLWMMTLYLVSVWQCYVMLCYVTLRYYSYSFKMTKNWSAVYIVRFESRYVHWFGLMRLYILHVKFLLISCTKVILRELRELERMCEQCSQNHYHFMKLYCIECIETFCQNFQNILTHEIVCNHTKWENPSSFVPYLCLSASDWHLASLVWNSHQMKLNRFSDIHRIIFV